MRNSRKENAEREHIPLVAVSHRHLPRRPPFPPTGYCCNRCEDNERCQRYKPVQICGGYGSSALCRGVVHERLGEVRPAGEEQVGHHRGQETQPAEVNLW